MTATARIHQADIERAAKAAKNAGWSSARISVDLLNSRIDIILSDSAEEAATGRKNPLDRLLEGGA